MLFFSSRKIFFSLINSFFFSIWTAKTSLRSVLTTIQISKKKELIAEKKKFLSEKKLRMRALPFQCNAFPATKKIYSGSQVKFFRFSYFNFYSQRTFWYLVGQLRSEPSKNGHYFYGLLSKIFHIKKNVSLFGGE